MSDISRFRIVFKNIIYFFPFGVFDFVKKRNCILAGDERINEKCNQSQNTDEFQRSDVWNDAFYKIQCEKDSQGHCGEANRREG